MKDKIVEHFYKENKYYLFGKTVMKNDGEEYIFCEKWAFVN